MVDVHGFRVGKSTIVPWMFFLDMLKKPKKSTIHCKYCEKVWVLGLGIKYIYIYMYVCIYIGDEIVYIYLCIGDEIYLYRDIYLFIYFFHKPLTKDPY